MQLRDSTKKSLQLINNTKTLNDDIYKKLLENCFSVLGGGEEIHANGFIFGSKPDLIKELYANILIATSEFVRNSLNEKDVKRYLVDNCGITDSRSDLYCTLYSKHKLNIEISLLNIGKHPPHIVDVDWKIDFVVKSNNSDESGGPIFRIGFTVEKFDEMAMSKKSESLNFTCDSRGMQDLVFKLKEAVRHCERLSNDL